MSELYPPEQPFFWTHPLLNVQALHANYRHFAYPPHSHEHYVISLIEGGVQSFLHRGSRYTTPPSGLILINPEVIHTGEPATAAGFHLRSIYPTVIHLSQLVAEMTGRRQMVPLFREVRVDDGELARQVLACHRALKIEDNPLTSQSLFYSVMATLIERYADIRPRPLRHGREKRVIQQARTYIEDHYARRISLSDIADHVALSPYHLLRLFRAEIGLPPHAYLQDVRIRRAQQLIAAGRPLVDVALAAGFSHQSHLTRCFKQVVGLTPGSYAAQING